MELFPSHPYKHNLIWTEKCVVLKNHDFFKVLNSTLHYRFVTHCSDLNFRVTAHKLRPLNCIAALHTQTAVAGQLFLCWKRSFVAILSAFLPIFWLRGVTDTEWVEVQRFVSRFGVILWAKIAPLDVWSSALCVDIFLCRLVSNLSGCMSWRRRIFCLVELCDRLTLVTIPITMNIGIYGRVANSLYINFILNASLLNGR